MSPFRQERRGNEQGDVHDESKRTGSGAYVIQRTAETRGGQAVAARQLGVSVRQVKRLVRRYRQHGVQGLVSQRRGRPSPREVAPERRAHILAVVRQHYADFGPTLACEKLQACHGVCVSRETLRQWLIAAGLWQPKRRRALGCIRADPAGPVSGNCCKSTARPMTGSRAAPRFVPYWSSLTTPPVG
ncbi:MAG: helix-turn-helix domain-containing protein [Nitrospira sp.]|nr:helix-turn-helix domain-containing protein [Nitrospira sp.]MDE0403766.1 helix-turn-helix domain-containing protein [Nitrospira sp.]MDE0486447.1 helix-turn-helix domain-containing protein [Nitrospira sp.]